MLPNLVALTRISEIVAPEACQYKSSGYSLAPSVPFRKMREIIIAFVEHEYRGRQQRYLTGYVSPGNPSNMSHHIQIASDILTRCASRSMKPEVGVSGHLFRSMSINGLPGRVCRVGKFIWTNADGMTVLGMESQQFRI